MNNIPLFFRFEHIVFGRGFLADVRFLGRATCTREDGSEDGSAWMYGVNPGALAEEGNDMKSAVANFREALTGVLFDLAEGSGSFEEFRAAAQSFYEATDAESVAEWEEARQAIREGADPDLDPGLDLRRETGDSGPDFKVVEVLPSDVSPALNHFPADQPSQLAA